MLNFNTSFCSRNMYLCPKDSSNSVKHLSVAINKWKYRLQYENYFGGVSAISKKSFIKVYVVNTHNGGIAIVQTFRYFTVCNNTLLINLKFIKVQHMIHMHYTR